MSDVQKHTLRSEYDVFLVGKMSVNIMGAKLPSIRQILKVLFYNTRIVKLTVDDSAKLAVEEAKIFWQKARIPTQRIDRCIELKKIHKEWGTLLSNRGKTTDAQRMTEAKFSKKIDSLFDIASADALDVIRIESDKEFLKMQRQDGRPGCMLGVDVTLAAKEKRTLDRMEKEDTRKQKHAEQMDQIGIYNIQFFCQKNLSFLQLNQFHSRIC